MKGTCDCVFSCVYRYLRVILKNDMCEKMLAFVRKLVVMHFLQIFSHIIFVDILRMEDTCGRA